VIAVDISAQPREQKTASSFEMLLQTFAIMGQSILAHELKQADVVVRPNIGRISGTDFQSKHLAILEGERAAQAQVAAIKAKLAALSAVAR
jgi:NTE family protein